MIFCLPPTPTEILDGTPLRLVRVAVLTTVESDFDTEFKEAKIVAVPTPTPVTLPLADPDPLVTVAVVAEDDENAA